MELFWPRRERLEWELQQLASAGYKPEVLSGDPSVLTPLVARISYSLPNGTATPLLIRFPELYPYFRLLIEMPEITLPHHQHPFAHHLCLLGRGTDQWYLTDSAAGMVRQRVPLVLEAGREAKRELVEKIEQIQAEPFSDYYPYIPDAAVVIDGSWGRPTSREGRLVLGLREEKPTAAGLFPLVVIEVQDPDGVSELVCDPRLAARFPARRYGYWRWLEAAIRNADARRFHETVISDSGSGRTIQEGLHLQGFRSGSFRAVATLFPEEHAWRDGDSGVGWVSSFEWRRTPNGPRAARRKAKKVRNNFFVRTVRSGPSDLRERVPELIGTDMSHVAVFGLGCIGAPAALAMAQSGVGHLALIDSDHVDPGTSVRWPLGVPAFGLPKAVALSRFIEENFAYTRVTPHVYRVGGGATSDGETEVDKLGSILNGVSLVLDATAEHGVQRFLSAAARSLQIPYVWVSGTPGGWGGFVGLSGPSDDDACWSCIETAQEQGRIPCPPQDGEHGEIQPAGCGDPTFAATGFDMQTIALSAVRMAVGLLSHGDGSYPRRPWNAEVISLRAGDGSVTSPTWYTALIEKDPKCRVCGTK